MILNNKKRNAQVLWFTGMSGAGKTTLANLLYEQTNNDHFKVLILDGDIIRDKYPVKLGFEKSDVEFNNMNVVDLCNDSKSDYDLILVPIISPFDDIRKKVRSKLNPDFKLVYIKTDIDLLKKRDVKGLYLKADTGEINNLIGYSKGSPYDIPSDADIIIDTSKTEEESLDELFCQLDLNYCNSTINT